MTNINYSDTLSEKVNLILDELEMVYKNDNRPWIIGYSGGKDSTALVQLTFMMLQRLPKNELRKTVYVVSSDTLIENPIVLGLLKMNLDAISEKAGANELNLKLEAHMVHPEYNNTFWSNIIGKGLPTPTSVRFRWCTERLKIKPSNKFIQDKVAENGEVIVLLGVRKSESIVRKSRIEKRQIEGYLLTPHVTLTNTYVYNPIVELSTVEIWKILLSGNKISPWGVDNNELHDLYMGSDGGECPFTMTANKKGEIDTPSCGNSRFGCWICTVVSKDKSLSGFIQSGETWLFPLSEFREWILSIRNKHEYRQQYRRDGNPYYRKIYIKNLSIDTEGTINEESLHCDESGKQYIDLKFKDIPPLLENNMPPLIEKDKLYMELLPLVEGFKQIDMKKLQEDEKGQYINVLGYGPFTFEARKIILRKLLTLQKKMQEEEEVNFDLIAIEELKAIDDIWEDEEDLSRSALTNIYYEIYGKKLPWHDFKKPLLEEIAVTKIEEVCKRRGVSKELLIKLLVDTDKYKYYSNKTNLVKALSKTLNQKYLYKDIYEAVEYDN